MPKKMGYGMNKSSRSGGKGGGQDKGGSLGSGDKAGNKMTYGSGEKCKAAGPSATVVKNDVQR